MTAVTFEESLNHTRLSRRSVWVAALASTAVVFDGYDLQALSYTLPKIVHEWHVPPIAAGLLASYTFIGLFIGAVGLGALGDRWGRKRAILVGVVIFALFMGSAGFARGYTEFALLRFAASIGMGGVLPGTIAMMSEYVPVRRRARMISVAAGCFTFGFAVAAMVATVVVPHFGWRLMFHLSYLAILVAVLIAVWVPEPPQYLANRGDHRAALDSVRRLYPDIPIQLATGDPAAFFASSTPGAARGGFRVLWHQRYLRQTVAISFLYLFLQFVVYAVDFWMVSLLVVHGESLVSSYSYAIEQALAATLGGFALGWLLDRVNQYLTLIAAFATGGIFLALFGLSSSLIALYTLNALVGALIIGGQNVVHTLVAATYDTHSRATGLGWALGIGRLGGLLGPLIGGYLLSLSLPYPLYFILFAIPSVLCALAIVALRSTNRTPSTPAAPSLTPS